MKTINTLLVESIQRETDLVPAMEALIDLAILEDAKITLENFVERYECADGNIVDILNIEQDYKAWLGDSGLHTISPKATGEAVRQDINNVLASIANPSMESDLVQELKRTYNKVVLNLKTFGKDLFDIKNSLRTKIKDIEAAPVLLESVETYRFLRRDNVAIKTFPSALDDDIAFIEACEKHYKALFDKSTDLSKRFRAACKSKSIEDIRECIDYFDEGIIDRQSFENLAKFNLLGNRVVEIDGKGYPKISKLKGEDIKFNTKAGDENNLVTGIAKGTIHGFSVGGAPKKIAGITGFNAIEGKKKFAEGIKKTGGEIAMVDFMKMLDKAQTMNQDSVRFAQMAAQMGERVLRMQDDLADAYEETVDEETGKFDKALFRDLMDLHKSARRSASQYMFLGKLLATIMEDHSTFVYRGVTTMANTVLKQAKTSEA